MQEILEKLAAANINLLPAVEISTHFVFERDGYVALVERRGDRFGKVGTAGLMTSHGIAFLMKKEDGYAFVAKGVESPATPDEVEQLRRFQRDLDAALAPVN